MKGALVAICLISFFGLNLYEPTDKVVQLTKDTWDEFIKADVTLVEF
jgi:protein disulfide-isomerase-like protein